MNDQDVREVLARALTTPAAFVPRLPGDDTWPRKGHRWELLDDWRLRALHAAVMPLLAQAWQEGLSDGHYEAESVAEGNDDEGSTPNPYLPSPNPHLREDPR